jgi:dihydroxyacetone kinase DhaKLM complex PTS-EIIA-like component DhaM
MKQRLFFLLLAFCAAFPLSAQFTPQGFNYQSIIRSGAGTPLGNQTVTLLFSIRSGAPNGPVAYSERQVVSTNEFGLVNLVIGQGGTPLLGDFGTINWGGGAKYLSVSVESSPNVFDEIGSSQLMSVPYALYAQSTANGGGGGNDNWGSQVVQTSPALSGVGTPANPLTIAQQNAQTGQVLKWNGTAWAPANDISSTGNNGGTVTQIATGAGLTGGPITTTGTIGLSNTGVTPGPYGSATEIPVITVDAQGRVTDIFKTVVQPGTVGIAGSPGLTVQQNGFNFTLTNTGDTNASDDLTTASTADGDLSGPFNNLQIKANAVGGNEIANNAVGTAEIINGAVSAAKLSDMGAANGQVLKWNGSAWAPAADQSGISTVGITAGAGISVTGSSPNFSIANTGDTNASDDLTTASTANGDIGGTFSNLQIKADVVTTTELANNAVETANVANGAITAAKLDDMGAANGQVLKWNGSTWAPAADGGSTATVTAGDGIDVTSLGSNFTVINTGDTNAADDITTASNANGDVSGPFSNLQIKADVVTTTELANNAVETANLANSAVTAAKLDDMGAANGQVLKWNGTTWAPAADISGGGGGGGDTYLPGTGINVTGSSPTFTIVNTGDTDASDDLTSTSTANGDVSGTFSNLQIKADVVTTTELANNAVETANVANGAITAAKLDDMGAANGQVLKWNGTTWAPAADNTGGGGGGNTYTAGAGINITGTAPNQTIVNTGDLSTTNELQSLSLNGSQLSLSNGGGTVNLPSGNSYTAGTGISITGTAPNLTITNTGDADKNPSNELQTLSLLGSILEISGVNSPVDLAPVLTASSYWKPAGVGGVHIYNSNTSNVLIGTNTSGTGKLQVIGGATGPAGYFSSNAGKALITDQGFVGINNPDPLFRLDVKGASRILGAGEGELQLTLESETNKDVTLLLKGGAAGKGWYMTHRGTESKGLNFIHSPGGTANGFRALNLDEVNRSVHIGDTTSGVTGMQVNLTTSAGLILNNVVNDANWEFRISNSTGNLQLYSNLWGGTPNGTFAINGMYTPSDSRLKKDIVAMPSGTLYKIMQLSPVAYRYNVESESAPLSLGFLAQDVQKQFPELVGKNDDRHLSLNYAGFGVLSIKAIQEQQVEIEQLKAENKALRQQMEGIVERLRRLEEKR